MARSLSGAFGRWSGASLSEAQTVESRVEKLLQAHAGLRLVSVARIVLKAVGEHQLHVGDVVACRNPEGKRLDNHQNAFTLRIYLHGLCSL